MSSSDKGLEISAMWRWENEMTPGGVRESLELEKEG